MAATDAPNRLARLSRDDIIDTAMSLVRSEGVEKTSMRRLADALGVTVGATYYYFRNKEDLVGAVAERIVSQIISTDDPQRDWTERLHNLLLEQDHQLTQFRGVAAFLVRNTTSRAALLWSEAFLEVLTASGMNDDQVADAFATVTFYVNPTFLVSGASRTNLPALHDLGANAPEFPNAARLAALLTSSFADQYARGAKRLVEAIANTHTAAPAPRPAAGRSKPARK